MDKITKYFTFNTQMWILQLFLMFVLSGLLSCEKEELESCSYYKVDYSLEDGRTISTYFWQSSEISDTKLRQLIFNSSDHSFISEPDPSGPFSYTIEDRADDCNPNDYYQG